MNLIILSMFYYSSCLEVKEMESLYQYSQKQITLSGIIPSISTAFRYGLWSKYNPLTSILQVGNVGLFDSHCYHLHSAVEESSLNLNFIYYDCIDDSLKRISKTIAFIDNNNVQHSFTIDLDPFEYENIWYYFQIIQWPLQERFELICLYQQKTIRENLKITQPFKNQRLMLIFGGGMIVKQSMISTILSGTKFSYFPGKMVQVEYEFGEISVDEDQEELARMTFEPYNVCNCKINNKLRIEDNAMKYLDNLVFTSENINCNSFELSGWLKITDIINQSQDEFIYPFLILSSNFQNSLSKRNLSPFTLSYKISGIINQIIITTYSYTFPSVISDDQQLIEKEFDIQNSITLWQQLKIKLVDDQLIINIRFYENYDVYEYSTYEQVKQFKCTQYKLQYGNINQSKTNYLNILFRNILFNNCETDNTQQSCHHSCLECDGPSQNNCLSCSDIRIYLPEFKACVCPFNTIDKENCVTYKDSKLELSNLKKVMPKCKYGYFEYENDCIRCPSIINDQLATCQECLQNPQGWSKDPYCQNDLFLNQKGDVKTDQFKSDYIYFLFDGIDLIECLKCNSSYSFIVDDYDIETEITLKQQTFLLIDLDGCLESQKNIHSYYCIQCYQNYQLIDGNCILINEYSIEQFACLVSEYLNSQRQCKLCPILNCKYCFEYQSNDLSKCTLYNNFDDFDIDQEIKIGCALCEDNFIFDFDIGVCQFYTPKIQNCLKSYIYNGQEVCTLSQIHDFSLAPEIINCQNLQPNCLQCIQSPEFTIKCIVCQIGYITSISTGGCYLADEYKQQGAKIIIEGVYPKMDGWVLRIQSFMMKFLPNQYFYFQSKFDQVLSQMVVECLEGYRLSPYFGCFKNCDPLCLDCKYDKIQGYYCNTCPLNQYYQPIRNQIDGKCFECTQLCQACQVRTNNEIISNQPNFIIDDNNQIFTKKCLKTVNHPQIYLDPYDQIAKYCFDENCSSIFQFQKIIDECYFFHIMWEEELNIEYLNKLGIDSLIVRFTFTSTWYVCQYANFFIDSKLKTKIFQFKYLHIILDARKDLILQMPSIMKINNVDKLEINQIIFYKVTNSIFNIENNNQNTELSLQNVTFLETEIKNIQSIFQSKRFVNVHLINIQLLNLQFDNSSILNLKDCLLSGITIFENFVIRNSTFLHSNVFQFINNQVILSVKNLIIEDCVITNSNFFLFDSNIQQLSKIEFLNIVIKNSKFINSSLFNCQNYVSLSLVNLQFQNNSVLYSNIFFSSNYILSLKYFQVKQNQFQESQFICVIEKNENLQSFQVIDQFEANNNQLYNSKFLRIQTNIESSQVDLVITNLIFDEIVNVNNSDNNQYLFKIRCFKLQIQDLIFRNLKNILIFNIFEGKDIMISNILYENPFQIYQLPFLQNCQIINNDKNQLLKIDNFHNLIINSIQIINQFTIDESFVDFSQAKEFSNSSKLELSDLNFIGNLQLFKKSQKSFSLLTINSEQSIKVVVNRITFLENSFHSQAESIWQSYASLIFLNIKSSQVQIINLLSERNAFTNSSNSFIFINSKTIFMQNLQISNHNILSQKLWEKYYNVKLDQIFNQQQINLFALQALNIKNIGGVAQITATMFTCLNCQFYNILSSKSAIFEIKTEDFGIINLTLIKANNIINDLKQVYNSSGCISIYTINSLLDITIQQSEFKNVFNRMSSSILSIQPSSIKNKISLMDIQIYDCLSLMNQILLVEFSNKIIDQNQIKIQNIMITQNLDSWILLFSQMGNLSLRELLDISSSQNSLFYIEGCSMQMINVSFVGVYLSPILSIVNAPIVKLKNLHIKQLQRFYSFNFININQMIDIESKVLINKVSILNSLTYQAGLQKIIIEDFNFLLDGCVVIVNQSNVTFGNQNFYFLNDILQEMEKNKQTPLSLIYIKSLQNKHSFYFNQLQIVENNCINYINGLIYFDLLTFNYIKIQELNCYYNVIQQYGCLKIVDENVKSQPIQVISSNFIQNTGSQGVAISSNSPILIQNCKIISNTASQKGGGIYFKLKSDQFNFKNSIIIGNKAKEGGGIYFSGDSNLNQHNFIQTYLLYNYAYDYANNLVESPTHLALFINSLEMQGKQQKFHNIQTNILRIFPYMTIEQEIKIKTSYLMIPSGSTIQGYSLVIPKYSQSIRQIQQIELLYKNNLNELQKNLVNSSCIITENIVKKNEQIDVNQQHVQLNFNAEKNHFDLSSLSFTLDPYIQDYKYLEIDITCSTLEYKNSLKYIIQAKSYKCQLGEFYVANGCQLCESNKGFYSVTYDSNKCSIFDKEKFEEISSNQIKLLEGFWRPNYLSDQSTQCFKITKFCLGGWNVGDALCSEGHVGALCEECDIYNVQGNGKFIKNQQNSECFVCFSTQDSIIPFIFNTLWAILSIILTLKSIGKSNNLFLFYKIQGSFNQILFKLNQDFEGILIKMLLNYLWIFSVIFSLNINFSFQFNFVDQASNQSYSMANNLDCYLSEIANVKLIYSKIILILILILLQFVIIIFGLIIFSIFNNQKFKLDNISNTLLCLYIFNYAGFIKMLCSVVSYREISNIQYISGDLTLEFNTDTHHKWIMNFVLPGLIIFGFLIPFLLFLLMYFKRNDLDNHIFRPHICYLYNEYEKQSYYWEQIKLSKRAIMILILTYFETNIHLKASLIGLSLIIYQLIAINKKPYIMTKLNKFDLSTGQICSISIFLSTIKYESEKLNNKAISLALQICLMILFVLITFPFIYNILKIYYKKYKLIILKYLFLLLKYFRLKQASKKIEFILNEKYQKEQRIKDNYLKLKSFLLIISKAQLKYRPAFESTFNSRKKYQQKYISSVMQGQSILLTGQRLQ